MWYEKRKSNMPDELLPSAADLLERVRGLLRGARHDALVAVNVAMVQAYWNIGREIVEEEQRGAERADYGSRLLEMLSQRLTAEFGKGFDASNLRYMRLVYLAFPIRDALRHELSWTHYRLLCRVTRAEARHFYLTEAISARWSTRELERQIHSFLYERLAASRDKEGVLRLVEQGAHPAQPEDLLRDPFVLEFTGLPERGQWQESDLEQALMDRLQAFLLEMGRDLFLVARQKRITIEDDHFYIDLVMYHRTLRCFVLIDLKTGRLTHQDVGQMMTYVGYYEAEETRPDENPPVGILLCADRNATAVRYAVGERAKQVFAARYQLHLPTEDELQRELETELATLITGDR
jgi:predicted nuclease of restriction endonuclease-like (RecB) superfamily